MEEDDGDPADRRLTGAPFRARSRSRENPAKNVHDMKGQEQEHLKEQEQEEEEEIKRNILLDLLIPTCVLENGRQRAGKGICTQP